MSARLEVHTHPEMTLEMAQVAHCFAGWEPIAVAPIYIPAGYEQ